MIPPLEIRYEVRGYDCGYGGPLTPLALANFFQEAAGAHASQIGIGMEDLWAKGLTWMLSRIDIRIESLPQAGQTVIARTWPSGTKNSSPIAVWSSSTTPAGNMPARCTSTLWWI